jgi:hypothetical protein
VRAHGCVRAWCVVRGTTAGTHLRDSLYNSTAKNYAAHLRSAAQFYAQFYTQKGGPCSLFAG